MSYTMTPDWTTLPTALLPAAKRHMRVDFADDDTSITEYVQFAIAYLQAFWGLQIFAGDVAWSPTITQASRYQCPVQPVASFKVMSGTMDVSSEYALESASPIEPVWLVHSDGTPFPSDAVITLVAGIADATKVPPLMLASILRVAATLYEHRESITTLSLDQMPFWMNDILTELWVPRA